MFPATRLLIPILALLLAWAAPAVRAADEPAAFPPPLASYGSEAKSSVLQVLRERAAAEPFNVIASAIFLLAIGHTFLASKFTCLAHRWRDEERSRRAGGGAGLADDEDAPVSFKAEIMHFLGEVEAIFGLWVVPLLVALTWSKGWAVAERYLSHGVSFTEPMFVVIVMAISATRPVLRCAEQGLSAIARMGRGTPGAWWLTILTLGPLLGSFITEPAAMTICALLLARQFYVLKPSARFRYATLGLLFVNVSAGGTLTHFAAPPVLMVAAPWHWDAAFMLAHFGWKTVIGIVVANGLYYALFRRELVRLRRPSAEPARPPEGHAPIPPWITLIHLAFLGWTVFTAHDPPLFIGGFLFFLAFTKATAHHQDSLRLEPALLVGFFLAGLVIHGGLQGWWIEPILARLGATSLMVAGMVLTSINDNAAITYLATLVPNLSETMRFAIVAGAVTGGGLTVIANAPNPAGQSILEAYFEDGISPLKLLLGALLPTAVMLLVFLFL